MSKLLLTLTAMVFVAITFADAPHAAPATGATRAVPATPATRAVPAKGGPATRAVPAARATPAIPPAPPKKK
jgi:hypothetical protein